MIESSCEQLDAYLAGELTESDRAAFEVHLARCSECAEAVASEQRLNDLLVKAVSRTSTDRDALVRGIEKRIHRTRQIEAVKWASGIALAIVAVAIALPIAWQSATTPSPETNPKQAQAPRDPDSPFPNNRPAVETIVEVPPQNRDDTLMVTMPSTNPKVTIVWLYPVMKPVTN